MNKFVAQCLKEAHWTITKVAQQKGLITIFMTH